MLRKERKLYARWSVWAENWRRRFPKKKGGNTEHSIPYTVTCSVVKGLYGAVISHLSALYVSCSLLSTYDYAVFAIFWVLMDCYKPFVLFYLFTLHFKHFLDGLCRPLNVQFCTDRCFLNIWLIAVFYQWQLIPGKFFHVLTEDRRFGTSAVRVILWKED